MDQQCQASRILLQQIGYDGQDEFNYTVRTFVNVTMFPQNSNNKIGSNRGRAPNST
jgi:hypothetical protein